MRRADIAQETGRGGRDGQQSLCVLFWSYGDAIKHERFINDGEGTREHKESKRRDLRAIQQYCVNKTDCRRTQVLQYFGETFSSEMCGGTCDNCDTKGEFELKDVTESAVQAIKLARSIPAGSATMCYLVDVFRGSRMKKVCRRRR